MSCCLFSAKFTSLEQPDKEPLLTDTNTGSLDGTGQVGTYFYTAPEIAQGWPTIDEKVSSRQHPFMLMNRTCMFSNFEL